MKILVTEPLHFAEEARRNLAALGAIVFGPFSDCVLARELLDCNVLMVRLGRYIGETLIASAPNLHFILTATTGLDHIDLRAAHHADVRVISLRDCPEAIADVSATAEHSFGLLLALMRRTTLAADHVLDGGWDRNRFWGTQLRGKRLGIVGYGRIGAMVARYGAAFGMKVGAYDREPTRIAAPAEPMSFEALLRLSDVISIHVTANPSNRHLIDREAIAQMKPSMFVINTARGSIIDEAALAEALSHGRVAGVAVDVLEGEECRDIGSSPLLACARTGHNVLITPHIGGATREAIQKAEVSVVAVLSAILKGQGS
jgi:D-3-phosphoglycerate dehydrogenase